MCSICQLLVTQLSETPAVFKNFNPEGVAQLTNHIFRDWIVCGACGHGGHTNCMLKEKNQKFSNNVEFKILSNIL